MEKTIILKQRLSVFLSVVMFILMVFGIVPQTQVTVQAAKDNISFSTDGIYSLITIKGNSEDVRGIIVEQNQMVAINQMYTIYNRTKGKWYSLDNLKGVKYSLKKTSAATLSKNGVLKTKKPGYVQGTITYQGKRAHFVCKIVKKGKLGTNKSKYNKLHGMLKKLYNYNNELTTENCYDYLTVYRKIDQSYYNLGLYNDGSPQKNTSIKENVTVEGKKVKNVNMLQLVIPEMFAYDHSNRTIWDYSKKHNPVGTVASKQFKIKGVSAKKNSKDMVITVSSKAKRSQIFSIKQYYSTDVTVENDKTAVFPIYVRDQNNGEIYRGKAVAHEGSNKITVTMSYMKFTAKHRYQLISEMYRFYISDPNTPLTYDWTRHKSVKVK